MRPTLWRSGAEEKVSDRHDGQIAARRRGGKHCKCNIHEQTDLTTCAAFMSQGQDAPRYLTAISCAEEASTTFPFSSTALGLSELLSGFFQPLSQPAGPECSKHTGGGDAGRTCKCNSETCGAYRLGNTAGRPGAAAARLLPRPATPLCWGAEWSRLPWCPAATWRVRAVRVCVSAYACARQHVQQQRSCPRPTPASGRQKWDVALPERPLPARDDTPPR